MGSGLREQLLEQGRQFGLQWQESSRLRWMLWGVLYIILFYTALMMTDWKDELSDSVVRLQQTKSNLWQLETQTQWPERLRQEQAVTKQLEQRFWQAKSQGLAEADFQTYLRRQLSAYQVQHLRIQLAPTQVVELAKVSLWQVSAEVSGSMDVSVVNQLLSEQAAHNKTLVLDRFEVADPDFAGEPPEARLQVARSGWDTGV